jgi:hypothetical protein
MIHYHPSDPICRDKGQFEFIELLNITGMSANLSGSRFTGGS